MAHAVWTVGLIAFASNLIGEVAKVKLICRSLRFTPDIHSSDESLAFTVADTLENVNNGELGPRRFGQTNSLSGFYRLRVPTQTRPRIDDAILTLPPYRDANGNGIADFFESGMEVEPFSTSGTFEDPNQNIGGISVTWSRRADSTTGTCDLQFVSSATIGLFSLPFTLLEYSGTMNYSKLAGAVVGTVTVTNGTRTISGQVRFQVLHADQLQAGSGIWSSGNTAMPWTSSGPFQRFGAHYVTDMEFADGDPDTALVDYQRWTFWIFDPNDADGNGVPNLTDAAPEAPQCAITADRSSQLTLSVSGSLNRLHEIQSAEQLFPALWKTIQTAVLTNTTQTFSLPMPAAGQSFFRVRVP